MSFFFGLLIILFGVFSSEKVGALYVCPEGETLSYDTAGNPICIGAIQQTGFVSTGEMIEAAIGATDTTFGYDGLYLYSGSSVIQSEYFGTMGGMGPLKGIINNIGIKKTGDYGTMGDQSRYGFSKCIDIPTEGEYIVAGAGSNGLRITLDGLSIINNEAQDGSAYKKYWMYPIYLPSGGHLIQYEYRRGQTNETLAGQFIGPFPQGSMIDYTTNSLLSTFDIVNFINSAGTESFTFDRYAQTVTAPSNWVDNIVWGTDGELGLKTIIGPEGGYTCPSGYIPNVVEGSGANACGNHGCLKINTSAATYVMTVPTIVITAPTKNSSGNITNTTIRVTGTGIYATGVSIDPASTTNPTNLVCVETTPGAQVDCTILIQQSGTLSINAVNQYDTGNASEPNYVIDPTPPVITITNNVNPSQNSGDEVMATISDNYCLATGSVYYSYSDDAICDASDALNIPYQTNDIIGLYDTSHNGKYVCFVAQDCVGNITYQGTTGPINVAPELTIAITAPTKTSSGDISNTTIRVTGTGVYATGVSIDTTGSTANPTNLVCTNIIEGTQVDCTVLIQQSGDLKINATSAFGNGIGLEQNYIIDRNKPTISIIDNVNTSLNSGDTIVVGVVDDILLMSGSMLYGFNSGATCDVTSIYDTSYISGTIITLNNNIYNGKYICFTAKDWVGNTSYTGSMGPINVVGSGINISIVAPTKTAKSAITDTTIRVVGPGMYATGVSIGDGTTVNAKNLVCNNTISGVQVDCTIVIQKSGLLKINGTNGSATGTATEPNYIIDIPTGGGFGGGYPPSTGSTPTPVIITPVVPKPIPIAPIPPKPNPTVKEGCYSPNNDKTVYQGNDVSALFRDAHQMLYNYEVTSYKGTAEYRPDHYLLRQEAARFMTEFAKNVLCRQKNKVYENRFNDLAGVDPTLKSYIIESYEYGIFKGDSGGKYTTFRPKEFISKNELAAIMIRLITNEFSEEAKGDWSKDYRVELEKYLHGIEFSSVLRENVAEVIYSLYKNNTFEMKDVGFVIVNK